MKKALASLAGLSLLCACVVTLPDILEREPVRAATFEGSHVEMAECVRWIAGGGKLQPGPDGTRIDVYNSKKIWNSIGVTHYAVSMYRDGKIELRKLPRGELSKEADEKLWAPIEDCIRRAYEG